MSQRSKYCLVGIPDDQGVLNVGGRVGAAGGPAAFRRAFARLHGREEMHDLLRDLGDVGGLGGDVVVNHRLAAEAVSAAHVSSGITLVVGGGHDHGFSHLMGISRGLAKGVGSRRGAQSIKLRLGCINIDAHLDVRKPSPMITSGSPFYLAIESGVLDPSRFVEFGIQSHCNRAELWDYASKKKFGIVPFERLRNGKALTVFKQTIAKLTLKCDAIVISMDLDAAAESHAPGVSAPQCEGFTSSEMVQMAELAGQARKVVSLGIFELNPVHDIGDRTARLGAIAAWHFLAQVAKR